jgi:hypothetical protein
MDLDVVLKLSENFEFTYQPEKKGPNLLIVDKTTKKQFAGSDEIHELLQLADGKVTLGEIAKKLSEKYEVSLDEVTTKLSEIADKMYEIGVLQISEVKTTGFNPVITELLPADLSSIGRLMGTCHCGHVS